MRVRRGFLRQARLSPRLRRSWGVFDDAKPERHRLRQCNTVADPGRRDRDTGAGKISGNVFGEPLTWRHSVQDDK
jgi:hypothetical protein